jgi:hypothetical protein
MTAISYTCSLQFPTPKLNSNSAAAIHVIIKKLNDVEHCVKFLFQYLNALGENSSNKTN